MSNQLPMSDNSAWVVIGILVLALVFFIWGKWRYDLVALGGLLAASILGLVPVTDTFSGLSHPAVVTVAAILVISRGLIKSGVVDSIGIYLQRFGEKPGSQIFVLGSAVMILSAFMNNVGALALFMPVAIQWGRKTSTSPGLLLMPLAFASLLGGLLTEIGTPPNLIISSVRESVIGSRYSMFDFTSVGFLVAISGLLFIGLIGWRFVPVRLARTTREEIFQMAEYTTEVKIPEASRWVGKQLSEIKLSKESEIIVLGIVRKQIRIIGPSSLEVIRPDDILILEGNTEALNKLAKTSDIEFVGERQFVNELLKSDEQELFESVILPGSIMTGRTARSLNLRWRYGLNLVAVARKGQRLRTRIGAITFQPGDLLLFQGRPDILEESMQILGTVLIGTRGKLGSKASDIWKAVMPFVSAVGLVAFGILPVEIAFTLTVFIYLVSKVLTLREAYTSVEWPILILLACMIPLGDAFESTGGARMLATWIGNVGGNEMPVTGLILIMLFTVILTNLINNAAAAVLMAPIAIQLAEKAMVSPDPMLMGVTVAASSAFMTPIGHQSNTLVMGPGGYRFQDYWKMGLPLTILIFLVSVPAILHFWPLK